ncbi:MAG: transposase [Bacteroidales bacterium]|nr:transposase [Bacteroidales bacterium]
MEKLQANKSYHIFNHANGSENLFTEDENYRYFLEKYRTYISPIAETYAYCLMPNHFHLVLRIRRKEEIEDLIVATKFSKVQNFGKLEEAISNNEIERFLSKQFSNFFSSYTLSFNKRNERMGSLFMKNFKRELISDRDFFLSAIVYTHRNPIHHGFCTTYLDWSYTSYSEIREQKSEIIQIEKLIKVFGGEQQFVRMHQDGLDKFKQSQSLDV